MHQTKGVSPIKNYLFDFDGTLVDSMPVFCGVTLRVLDENGISYEKDIIKTITPLGILGVSKYYHEVLGLSKPVEEIAQLICDYMYEEYLLRIPAKKNVSRVLRKLKEGGANLNVLTASPHLTLDPCLKRLGLYDLFTNVWSCDDFGTTKADPEIYRRAAEKIGAPVSEILFLDDNFNADKTAKEAGMKVCAVYDASSEEYIEEMKANFDGFIYDFSELLEIEL